MKLNLAYGEQLLDRYLDAGERIADDMAKGKIFDVSHKLNNVFFGGDSLSPKSFSHLLSIDVPESPWGAATDVRTRNTTIRIDKKPSNMALLGYVEGIPGIGSALAAIKIFVHLYGMTRFHMALNRAVIELKGTERSDFNVGRGESLRVTNKVFRAAIGFTEHQNYLVGSVLSLIPFVKPIVRLGQGLLYEAANRPPLQNRVALL